MTPLCPIEPLLAVPPDPDRRPPCAAVLGATEFDIYNFAGQMNPVDAPRSSYFSLVTYCTTCPCPLTASVDSIVFSGASLTTVETTMRE